MENCVKCGAPIANNKCEYCGTQYKPQCDGLLTALKDCNLLSVDYLTWQDRREILFHMRISGCVAPEQTFENNFKSELRDILCDTSSRDYCPMTVYVKRFDD